MKYYRNAKPGVFRDTSGFEAQLSKNGTMNGIKISKLCTKTMLQQHS